MEVEIVTAATDVHSGLSGGAVQNPGRALAQLLATMWHPNNSVAVAGFYDKVAPITDAHRCVRRMLCVWCRTALPRPAVPASPCLPQSPPSRHASLRCKPPACQPASLPPCPPACPPAAGLPALRCPLESLCP